MARKVRSGDGQRDRRQTGLPTADVVAYGTHRNSSTITPSRRDDLRRYAYGEEHHPVSKPLPGSTQPRLHRVLLAAFLLGLVAFVLLCLMPLPRVRLGSNLLVAAGTIFLAV